MNISKSRYVNYCQCPKLLWLKTNHPELADEVDDTVFKNGTMVGEIAQGLFPGGTLVRYDESNPHNIPAMLTATRDLVAAGEKVIYEAAFGVEGLLAICDILVRVEHDGEAAFDVYEVKSSTKLKDVYVLDVAFQQYVLGLAGINVRDTYIVHIDNSYVRQGALDVQQLFAEERVTELSTAMQPQIAESMSDVFDVLAQGKEPVCDIGLHCSEPYDCSFRGYCWQHVPPKSVFDIAKLSKGKKFDFYRRGIITFKNLVDARAALNDKQLMQIEAELKNAEFIDIEAIKDYLDTLYYPLYFLDFETFMPPVPLYDGTRPFEQIPSQYSLHHFDEKGGELKHTEFLAQEGTDPREAIARRLVQDIPKEACVLAYNMSFEKGVIESLVDEFPDLAGDLMAIHDHIGDLIIPFRQNLYYTKEMNGRSSIKAVLPALFPDDPELSYHDLELVHNGAEAMNAFPALNDMPAEERAQMRKSLLEYCKLDTLAMVKILEKLEEAVATS